MTDNNYRSGANELTQQQMRATPQPTQGKLAQRATKPDGRPLSETFIKYPHDEEEPAANYGEKKANSQQSKQSSSRISLSNSLQKQIDNFKQQKGLKENSEGKLVKEVPGSDSDDPPKEEKPSEQVEKKLTRMKKLHQFDIEWMDIQANVQTVLDARFQPYVDKQVDMELLLQFHDQVLRKQCEVLESLQQAVFMSNDIDFSSFYQVWQTDRKLPLNEQKVRAEQIQLNLLAQEEEEQRDKKEIDGKQETAQEEGHQVENIESVEEGQPVAEKDQEQEVTELQNEAEKKAPKPVLKKLIDRRVEKIEDDIYKLQEKQQIEAQKLKEATKSNRKNLRVTIKSTESEGSQNSIQVPKLSTGASYLKELHKESQPLMKQNKFNKKSGKEQSAHQNIFDVIFAKLNKVKQHYEATETRLNKQIEALELGTQDLGANQEVLRNEQKSIVDYHNKLQKDINDLEKQSEYFQSKIKQQIEIFSGSVLEETSAVKKSIGDVLLRMSHQVTTNHKYEMEMKALTDRIHKLQSEVHGQGRVIHLIHEIKSDQQAFAEREKNILQVVEKIKQSLDNKDGTIHSLERYIDVFMPIKMQTILSETMGAVLNRQSLNKLDVYEQEKYKSLNDSLLNSNALSVQDNMAILSREMVDYTQKFTLFSKKASHKQKFLSSKIKKSAMPEQQTMSGGDTQPPSTTPDLEAANQNDDEITVGAAGKLNNIDMVEKVNEVSEEQTYSQMSQTSQRWSKNNKNDQVMEHHTSTGNSSDDYTETLSQREEMRREKVIFSKLKNLTSEQQEEHRRMVDYLMSLDLSSNVDIIALTKLNFELSDREDDILLSTSKNTVYKILKIMLYQVGLIQGRMDYEMKEIEKRMDNKFVSSMDETRVLIKQLKAYKDTSLFEMQEFQTKISAVNASVGVIKQNQDNKLKMLSESMGAMLTRQDQLNQYLNEFMRIQNFIDHASITKKGIMVENQTYQKKQKKQKRQQKLVSPQEVTLMDLDGQDEQAVPEHRSTMSQIYLSPKIQSKSQSARKQRAQASEEKRERKENNPLQQLDKSDQNQPDPMNFAGHINTANVTLGPKGEKIDEAITPKQNPQSFEAYSMRQEKSSANLNRKRQNIDIKDIQKQEQLQTVSHNLTPRDNVNSLKLFATQKVREQAEQMQKLEDVQTEEIGQTTTGTGHFTERNNSKFQEDRTQTQLIQADQRSETRENMEDAKRMDVQLTAAKNQVGRQINPIVVYRERELSLENLINMQILLCDKIDQILVDEKPAQPDHRVISGQEIFYDLYDYFMHNLSRHINQLKNVTLSNMQRSNVLLASDNDNPLLHIQPSKFNSRKTSLAPLMHNRKNSKSTMNLQRYVQQSTEYYKIDKKIMNKSFNMFQMVSQNLQNNQDKVTDKSSSKGLSSQLNTKNTLYPKLKMLNHHRSSRNLVNPIQQPLTAQHNNQVAQTNQNSHRKIKRIQKATSTISQKHLRANADLQGPLNSTFDDPSSNGRPVEFWSQTFNKGSQMNTMNGYFPNLAENSYTNPVYELKPRVQGHHQQMAFSSTQSKMPMKYGKSVDRVHGKKFEGKSYQYVPIGQQKMNIRLHGRTKELLMGPQSQTKLGGKGVTAERGNAVQDKANGTVLLGESNNYYTTMQAKDLSTIQGTPQLMYVTLNSGLAFGNTPRDDVENAAENSRVYLNRQSADPLFDSAAYNNQAHNLQSLNPLDLASVNQSQQMSSSTSPIQPTLTTKTPMQLDRQQHPSCNEIGDAPAAENLESIIQQDQQRKQQFMRASQQYLGKDRIGNGAEATRTAVIRKSIKRQ